MPKVENLSKQLEKFESQFPGGTESNKIAAAYNSIVDQTRSFVHKAGFDKVVLGLSGGIDSALVAKIAVDCFGAENVFGLILPGPFSSQSSINDANELACALNIKTKTQFINSAYKAFMENIDTEDGSLTSQNVQARCRMIYIMAYSNQHEHLMLNTANKTEVYTGYSTMYGDMAGGYAPLGNTYKTDVFKMCVLKNLQAQRLAERNLSKNADLPIPEAIIAKPPSAELCENQTDENSLGLSYPMIDAILRELVDNKRSAADTITLGYPDKDVQLVASKKAKSEYKRMYEPPCPITLH